MTSPKPTAPGIAELLDACIDAHMGSYSEAVNDGPRARAAVLAHVADLEAQRDEALKDAGRYRWLRERINWREETRYGLNTVDRFRQWSHNDYRPDRPEKEHIDEYIDAALLAGDAGA